MLNLRQLLIDLGRKQSALAKHLGISVASVSLISNYDHWPKYIAGGEPSLRRKIASYLIQNGVTPERVETAFEECAGQRVDSSHHAAQLTEANASTPSPLAKFPEPHLKDEDMLLRKHTITADAREHFALPRDPFTNEMRGVADVFHNDNIRKVRAAVRNTAQHGGLLAVIGESGAGKSTIRKDLAEWIRTSEKPVIVAEPYIIGMEENDKKGRPLKSADIVSSVRRAVSPGTPPKNTEQGRMAQMHDVLKASAQAGNKHVLLIEEGHRLATPTIKHLKNFYELDDGFTSLLAIIIIGQTELGWKLGDNSFEVREVVQRCEKRFLEPLDNDVEAYLRHKFERVEGNYDQVFTKDVPEAILARLRVTSETRVRGQRTLGPRSLCYPLAINNLVSGAINLAHQGGEDRVSAKLIAQVGREDAE